MSLLEESISFLKDHFKLSDQDLRKPVSDILLAEISRTLSVEWRILPPYLSLKQSIADDIQREQRFISEKERRHEFFLRWKKFKRYEATCECLIHAFLKTENQEDAENVCKLFVESPDLGTS